MTTTMLGPIDEPEPRPGDQAVAAAAAALAQEAPVGRLEDAGVLADMDPGLQRLVERRRRGIVPGTTSSTDRGEVAVVAKVGDFETWRGLSEVRSPTRIAPASGGEIVTGRVPLHRIEKLRQMEWVYSLKPARPLRPSLAATTADLAATPSSLPKLASGAAGRGTVIGIVDYGCDFVHRNFRKADGSTRLVALWDQAGTATPDSPSGYGAVHEALAIDAALRAKDPYEALGYRPGASSHGTHVMDIAAGNGGGTKVAGVAPHADIVFVGISPEDVPWEGANLVEKSFGDSVRLLEALRFIFDRAGDRPCVVNVSLGTNGGPHDGSTLVEQGIDDLLEEKPDRAVVIAAGNAYDDGIHTAGQVTEGVTIELKWVIPPNDPSDNELEIWYGKGDVFSLTLVDPEGIDRGTVGLGESARLKDDKGDTAVFIAHRRGDPNNGDNVIGVFLERRFGAGTWTIRITGVSVSDGRYHAWIERDDRAPSAFAPPHVHACTLGSISTGRWSIVVGSYDAHKPTRPVSWFSAAGPTRDGRQKPEVCAPGHDVWAADAETMTRSRRDSGTSMAAPAVAGVVAVLLGEARSLGISLTAADVQKSVCDCARPISRSGWDDREGWGRVDLAAAIGALHQRAGFAAVGPTVAAPARPRPGRPSAKRRRPGA